MECRARVTVLGARGSIPVSGAQYQIYGGATSCVLLETGVDGSGSSQAVIFDAGSGIMNLPDRIWKEHAKVHVFFSHFHLDHLLGIPMSRMLFDETAQVIFYAQEGDRIGEVFGQMMKEPLWPVGLEAFRAGISYRSIGKQPVILGDGADSADESALVILSAMHVTHPGGAAAFRADWGGHSMVYATDCDPDEDEARALSAFAAGTDLFILDAQYTDAEYEQCRGFGHSSIRMASQLITSSKAKKGLLFHHAPARTDVQMVELERQLQQYRAYISFAREGESIII